MKLAASRGIVAALACLIASLNSGHLKAAVYVELGKALGDGYRTASVTWITNKIGKQDYEDLKRISATIPATTDWHISLNSSGGDVATAINMGRFLRARNASANVGANAICASACVFVLAGATQRAVQTHLGGKVGIHRPYDPNDQETTMEGQKKQQQQLEKIIKSFLSDTNVPESLYDEMLRVPPGEIRMLSASELRKYGLNANDPYWDDARETQEAKKLGMSRKEYLERKARARTICVQYVRPGKFFDDLICEQNVIRGRPPNAGFQ